MDLLVVMRSAHLAFAVVLVENAAPVVNSVQPQAVYFRSVPNVTATRSPQARTHPRFLDPYLETSRTDQT